MEWIACIFILYLHTKYFIIVIIMLLKLVLLVLCKVINVQKINHIVEQHFLPIF